MASNIDSIQNAQNMVKQKPDAITTREQDLQLIMQEIPSRNLTNDEKLEEGYARLYRKMEQTLNKVEAMDIQLNIRLEQIEANTFIRMGRQTIIGVFVLSWLILFIIILLLLVICFFPTH